MEYTLDSVHHFVQTLERKNKSAVVTKEPVLLVGRECAAILENNNDRKLYFGVFNCGKELQVQFVMGGVNFITILENSQIICGFQKINIFFGDKLLDLGILPPPIQGDFLPPQMPGDFLPPPIQGDFLPPQIPGDFLNELPDDLFNMAFRGFEITLQN